MSTDKERQARYRERHRDAIRARTAQWRADNREHTRAYHQQWVAEHPEYGIWRGILDRCTNPNTAKWELYGGRGITVCARWSESYDAFIADMGPRPSTDHSIDRIDVDGNYEPGNCRWATRAEQRANRRPIGTLVPVDVCERIVSERAAGASWYRIAQRLTADGVPTPHRRDRWSITTVRSAAEATTARASRQVEG